MTAVSKRLLTLLQNVVFRQHISLLTKSKFMKGTL